MFIWWILLGFSLAIIAYHVICGLLCYETRSALKRRIGYLEYDLKESQVIAARVKAHESRLVECLHSRDVAIYRLNLELADALKPKRAKPKAKKKK